MGVKWQNSVKEHTFNRVNAQTLHRAQTSHCKHLALAPHMPRRDNGCSAALTYTTAGADIPPRGAASGSRTPFLLRRLTDGREASIDDGWYDDKTYL
jgi:hypothetical protein